jgi:hypothetical protein
MAEASIRPQGTPPVEIIFDVLGIALTVISIFGR